MPNDERSLPGDLLQAIAQRNGRVTIVVGAGCSLEAPTGLELGSHYAKAAFDQLVLDEMMEEGECDDPWDLSQLATAVNDKFGSQRPLVDRLPKEDFQFAKANNGYLLAAALMAEGSVAYVATLNFDLALSNAVAEIRPGGVGLVSGPESYEAFGSKAVVYLHRNANEPNPDLWILRKEAIDVEWQEGWEAIAAQRISAAPIVIFAGLGSPALALTETLTRVQRLIPNGTHAYLVDPAETSSFATAINVDEPSHHIRLGWGDFMAALSERLVGQFELDIRSACQAHAQTHGIQGWEEAVATLIGAIGMLHLLGIGALRSAWLGSTRRYEPDHVTQRASIADLLLGLALFVRSSEHSVVAARSGSITVTAPGTKPITVQPASGCGVQSWGVVDLLAKQGSAGPEAVDIVLAAGFRGQRPSEVVPPIDITGTTIDDDITSGSRAPRILDLDDLRSNPELLDGIGN